MRNLHLAICGTDVLLCQQLWSWGCRPRASGWFRATCPPDHLIYCLNAQLKTGVNLHLAICGTDVLLCQQRKLGVPAPRKRMVPGYLIT